MAVYTKTGDKGETSLYDPKDSRNKRTSKDSCNIEAIGAVDELDSFIGVTRSFTQDKDLQKLLREVQKNLLTIGSILAGSSLRFHKSKTTKLEKRIDQAEAKLPVLKNFILPGGGVVASHLHYCRSLARRAERRVVALSKEKEIKPQVLMYINRLSDLFFMLAREQSASKGERETVWVGKKR